MPQLIELPDQRKEKAKRLAQLTSLKDQTPGLSTAEVQLKEFGNQIFSSPASGQLETRRLARDILPGQVAANRQKCKHSPNPSRFTHPGTNTSLTFPA
jgi:hypothetical protein